MPDFSRGGYYGKVHSRAYNTFVVALLVAGVSAVSMPLFISHLIGLASTYFGYALVAICGYRWGMKPALLVGALISLADLVLLSSHIKNDTSLQVGVGSGALALAALAVGFGAVGEVARDFHRVKFSDQGPKAADLDELMLLLEKELARVKRYRQPSSLAIVELTTLNRVAKAYGQHQTELMLRQIQLVFTQQLRRSDTLAWLGGPYFALLLPGTGREGAEVAIERLRGSLQSIPVRSFLNLGMDISDWNILAIELKGDEGDPYAALKKVASSFDPALQQRIGHPRKAG